MQGFVGKCIRCEKDIYCLDGFLNGIVADKGQLLCFDCEKEEGEISI